MMTVTRTFQRSDLNIIGLREILGSKLVMPLNMFAKHNALFDHSSHEEMYIILY